MLAQITTVKTRLGITSGVDDTILTNFIRHVSGRFDQVCNRRFERLVNATYEFEAGAREILPDRFPIETVASFDLKTTESEGWVSQTGYDFIIRRSCAVSLYAILGYSYQLGRMTYTGGYVTPGTTPGSGQTALPDEIEQSCVEQVSYWYQQRKQLGLISVSEGGASASKLAQLELLPNVQAALKQYIRVIM